jgi:hypothetical protein
MSIRFPRHYLETLSIDELAMQYALLIPRPKADQSITARDAAYMFGNDHDNDRWYLKQELIRRMPEEKANQALEQAIQTLKIFDFHKEE